MIGIEIIIEKSFKYILFVLSPEANFLTSIFRFPKWKIQLWRINRYLNTLYSVQGNHKYVLVLICTDRDSKQSSTKFKPFTHNLFEVQYFLVLFSTSEKTNIVFMR